MASRLRPDIRSIRIWRDRSGQLSGHYTVACLLACATGFHTGLTMLHTMLRMHRALVAAQLARLRTGLENATRHRHIEGRLSREHPARRGTDIGTIQVERDAARQHLRILLSQASIRTGDACLRAVKAGLDACSERGRIHPRSVRGVLDHLLCVTHS